MDLNVKQLVQAIRSIADEKNLPEEVVLDIVQQAIAAAWRRDHGDREQDVRAEMNTQSGDVTVFVSKEAVEEVENDAVQISLEDAKKIKEDAEVGDFVEESEQATSFGRVAAQTAKQVVLQKLREAEREVVMTEYADKIGTVIVGVVQRVESRVVRVELGKATGILPA
ncbi:transcription termination/antitermination protein NusA, partial [Candidatus Saccharibacteria bacterium]